MAKQKHFIVPKPKKFTNASNGIIFSLSEAFENYQVHKYLLLESNITENFQLGTNFHKIEVTLVFNISLDLYYAFKISIIVSSINVWHIQPKINKNRTHDFSCAVGNSKYKSSYNKTNT